MVKTTLTNEETRWFEAMHQIYLEEKTEKTWAQWLKDYFERVAKATPESQATHALCNEMFRLNLKLDRIEGMLLTVIGAVAPTATFAEVKRMFDSSHDDAAVHEWLSSHGIAPDSNGGYSRPAVVKAYGNPPLST